MGYVERCLYDYKANVAEIEILREELNGLMSLHGQSYEINNSQGEGDPVANIVNQGLILEKKIAKLEKRVKPVDKLLSDLKGSSLKVQQDKENIKQSLAVSERTLWRRTGELISLAKRYFGYVA